MKQSDYLFKLNIQLFAEEQQTNDQEQQENNVDPNANAIEALKKLKESTVSKEAYKKLEEQNRQLLDAVINGNSESSAEKEVPVDKKARILELADTLYGPNRKSDLTNLDVIKGTLELRKLLMEQGMTDPMVPSGRKVQASYTDFVKAEELAKELEACVEAADNDPVAFISETKKRGLK